jgi:hypothetical protein
MISVEQLAKLASELDGFGLGAESDEVLSRILQDGEQDGDDDDGDDVIIRRS